MSFVTLVGTADLAARLDDPEWVVIDCRFSLTQADAGEAAYARDHIPGAHYAHLERDLSGPLGARSGRHPLPEPEVLAATFGRWGIEAGIQVVAYDDSFGSMAARLWWLLRWLGHDQVALLDGGYPKWRREGRPLDAAVPPACDARFVPHPDAAAWVSAEDVESALAAGDRLLLDARPDERFSGEIEPFDRIPGHIPAAVNRPWEDNLALAGTYAAPDDLRAEYAALLRGRPPESVIHMCGSGVTACHNVLAMELAGLRGSRLYVGSWSEWITDPKHAVARGE